MLIAHCVQCMRGDIGERLYASLVKLALWDNIWNSTSFLLCGILLHSLSSVFSVVTLVCYVALVVFGTSAMYISLADVWARWRDPSVLIRRDPTIGENNDSYIHLDLETIAQIEFYLNSYIISPFYSIHKVRDLTLCIKYCASMSLLSLIGKQFSGLTLLLVCRCLSTVVCRLICIRSHWIFYPTQVVYSISW